MGPTSVARQPRAPAPLPRPRFVAPAPPRFRCVPGKPRRRASTTLRHHELAAQLLNSDVGSPYALRPTDPAVLHELLDAVDAAVDDGVNHNTAKGEKSAWHKYYLPYCRMLRIAAPRMTI